MFRGPDVGTSWIANNAGFGHFFDRWIWTEGSQFRSELGTKTDESGTEYFFDAGWFSDCDISGGQKLLVAKQSQTSDEP
ncbi:unnamed protein product [Cuscuta campestris]|uniref:Pectinesterase n=1 Tax=Cuscuta campestris TaxID=132261 RepID=A0A484KHQ1_9ASTE|nr:unnamed protein product [Cuscuta campestris]